MPPFPISQGFLLPAHYFPSLEKFRLVTDFLGIDFWPSALRKRVAPYGKAETTATATPEKE